MAKHLHDKIAEAKAKRTGRAVYEYTVPPGVDGDIETVGW